MDAMDMDEFQEADILWPDTEGGELPPFASMDTEELYEYDAAGSVPSSSVALAPVFGRRFEGFFLSGAGPGGASPDADDEEWQEADVLWPDTAGEPPGSGGVGSMWPFSGSSSGGRASRRVKPTSATRHGWTTSTGPAASSPINIPANAAPRRRFISRTAMNRRS